MDMEQGKKYGASSKGYNDTLYEVRFLPVMDRPEYQEGPVREALERLKAAMPEKDFERYINMSLVRITYDGSRLMIITKSELHRTMLSNMYFDTICEAFGVGNFRAVSEVNGY